MKLSTRLMFAMVALVLLSTTIIGVFTYRNIEALVLPRALARLDADARLFALELEASVRGARADALGFLTADGIARIVQAGLAPAGSADRAALPDLRARFAARLVGELAAKPNYAQFRVIGIADGGREGGVLPRVRRRVPAGARSAKCQRCRGMTGSAPEGKCSAAVARGRERTAHLVAECSARSGRLAVAAMERVLTMAALPVRR